MDFSSKVFEVCKKIPKGKVLTYGAIARVILSPSSARAVGNALNKNKNLVKIPCHRVVRSDGFVGGYAKGTRAKINLLKKEGVEVLGNGRIDLGKYLFELK